MSFEQACRLVGAALHGPVRREIVDNNYVGYGSAASTVLFLIIAVCTLLYLKLARVDLGGKK